MQYVHWIKISQIILDLRNAPLRSVTKWLLHSLCSLDGIKRLRWALLDYVLQTLGAKLSVGMVVQLVFVS